MRTLHCAPGRCSACGGAAVQRCRDCATAYCSAACQRRDWPAHRQCCPRAVADALAALERGRHVRLCVLRGSDDGGDGGHDGGDGGGCGGAMIGDESDGAVVAPTATAQATVLRLALAPLAVRDACRYALVRLRQNGLRALLCSDATLASTHIAVDVSVGSAHDPPALPGLSHLVEHLLFMGTRTRPAPDEFHEFVARHGGAMNAYTAAWNTSFQISVAPAAAGEALRRLAAFFVEPLLDAGVLERERNNVHAEHVKNLRLDSRRLHRLVTAASRLPAVAGFSTGTRETLSRPGVHAAAVAHARRHYGDAATLRVCVSGPHSEAALAQMLAAAFGGVATSEPLAHADADAERLYEPLYAPARLNQLVRVGGQDARTLLVTWSLPPYQRTATTAAALLLLQRALTDAAPGRLVAALQARGLVEGTSPVAVDLDAASQTSLCYGVRAALSARGLGADGTAGEAAAFIFAFIEALRASVCAGDDVGASLFGEAAQRDLACSQRLTERFGGSGGASESEAGRTARLAVRLRTHGARIFESTAAAACSRAEVCALLARLRPELARVYVAAPSDVGAPESGGGGAVETEPYFGIRYIEQPLRVREPTPTHTAGFALVYAPVRYASWRELCGNVEAGTRLLPLPASAAARHASDAALAARLHAIEATVGRGEIPYPRPVSGAGQASEVAATAAAAAAANVTVWHKRDEFYGVPCVNVRLLMVVPELAHDETWAAALAVLATLARRRLGAVLAADGAPRACVDVGLAVTEDGLVVRVDGFCGATAATAGGIVGEVLRSVFDCSVFNNEASGAATATAAHNERDATATVTAEVADALATTRAAYEAADDGAAYAYALDVAARTLLDGGAHEPRALAAALDAPTLPALAARLGEQLRGPATRIEALVHGNIEADAAARCVLAAVAALRGCGGGAAHSPGAWPAARALVLTRGRRHLCVVPTPAPAVTTAAAAAAAAAEAPQNFQHVCVFLLQAGEARAETTTALELLAALVEQVLYAQLRTREQLGYIVSTRAEVRADVAQLRVLVQSSTRPPNVLEPRIEAALAAACARVCAPAAEALWQQARGRLLERAHGRDATLADASATLLDEIVRAGRAHGSSHDAAAQAHLLHGVPGTPNDTAAEHWPRFNRRFYEIAALTALTHARFCALVRTWTAPSERRLLVVHVHDERDTRPTPAAAAALGTTLLRPASRAHQNRHHFLFPLGAP